MNNSEAYIETINEQFMKRFYKIYQGGHHDVWCNRKIHVTMAGGMFGTAPTNLNENASEIHINECDCK